MTFRGILSYFRNYSLGRKNVTENLLENSYIFNYPCIDSSECDPYEVIFSPGTYQIELWGAQGGDSRYHNIDEIRPNSGGKGAYVKGTIQFLGTTKLYLFIGGKGEDQVYTVQTPSKGGFNGGGIGGVDSHDTTYPESGAGGGGATDLRIFNGDDDESLKSRLIVAGAGGGGCSTNNTSPFLGPYQYSAYGGSGGALSGENSTEYGVAGSQQFGIFGKGGDGLGNSTGNGSATGGSGSGYFGGFTVPPSYGDYEFGGSGGSSYISGHEGCIAYGKDSSKSSKLNENSIHISNVFFTNTEMKTKYDEDFVDPFGNHEEGHSGNGCAKITVISSRDSLNIFPTCKTHLYTHNYLSIFACAIIINSNLEY